MDAHPSKRRKVAEPSPRRNDPSISRSRSDGTSSDLPTVPPSSSAETKLKDSKSTAQRISNPSWSGTTNASGGSNYSNLFKLQSDELLKEIRPKYETRFVDAEETLHRLREIVENIPDRAGLLAFDAQDTLKSSSGVRVPFPRSGAEATSKLLLAYARPANINVVGSFARKTALLLDGKVTIDVAVTMPSHLFQPKDYRDYRYFQKRAYYLACLANGIEKANLPHLTMSFAYQDDNPLQPILIVEAVQDDQGNKPVPSNYRIRILLAASSDLFPVEKTLSTKPCLRQPVLDGKDEASSPTYNATLRSECCSSISLKLLHRSIVDSDAFRDACMLGAVWLRQRGIGSSSTKGGFGQFEWASLMSMLTRGGGRANRPILSNGYSSYQFFKATLQFLATIDLIASPMLIKSANLKLPRTDHPIFFDGSRGLNLLFKMSPWSYKMLQHEAQVSLRTLNDPLVDHFKAMFISRVDEPSRKFDYVFRIPLERHADVAVGTKAALNWTKDSANIIHEKFTYGLGDRITLIYPQVPSSTAWPINSSPSSTHFPPNPTVGLLLNAENSRRTVDRGPPVDDKKASALFRQFWGDKAELRRFKDGAILESVLWNDSDSKHAFLDVIVRHILNRHFDIHESSDVEVSVKTFESLLPQQTAAQTGILGPFSSTRSAFETLCKSIRDLEGLPLQIRLLAAASPELRYSSVFAPIAGKPQSHTWPVEFQIQFEGSTRWPHDILAVQRTKIAFLLKIAEGLEGAGSVSAAAVGLDGKSHKLPEEPFLDIATVDGMVFRLRIHHEPELKILEQALHGQISSSASREELALAVSDYKRRYIQGPAHTQAVYALSTRFPLLSPTIRLLKKWRDAHLLSSHLRDELIELLAIRTFVHADTWQTPGSLNSAFVRILSFVANWDWQLDPLIVDFTSELNKQDIEAINVRFQAWRKLDPGMNRVAIFAASNIDREGITWTDRRPAKVIASRFSKLAAAASELIKEKGLELEPETLFVPSLREYDFVIHLKYEYGIGISKKSSFKNLQVENARDPLDAILNPAQEFCDELEELYGDAIMFFYNKSATTVIAGLWNPQTVPRAFKVDLDYNTMPVPGDGDAEPQVSINKATVLHDIARLGGDMIARVAQKP